MKVEELTRIGEAAYGKDWKYPLAAALDITREMLWRYQNEKTPINDEMAARIRKACRKQIEKNIALQQRVLERLMKAA